MAKTIRLTEPVYDSLNAIKMKLEQEATGATGVPMSMTFNDLVNILCESYVQGDSQ